MSIFASSKDLINTLCSLWEAIKTNHEMSKQLIESKLIVQFRYRDPEGLLTVDCSDGNDMKIIVGKTSIKPIIEMSMKADVAHEFWLGKVNMPMAIIMGKVQAKGPVPKALALLPVLKPAFEIYPNIFKQVNKKT
jgi:putative sterol carrier protein